MHSQGHKSGSVTRSFMSNSLWSHELQPASLLCPWDSPGRNRSGLPFPPDPGIEPASPVSPAMTGGFLTTMPPGKPLRVKHSAQFPGYVNCAGEQTAPLQNMPLWYKIILKNCRHRRNSENREEGKFTLKGGLYQEESYHQSITAWPLLNKLSPSFSLNS